MRFRLYIKIDRVEASLPYKMGFVTLHSSADTSPFSGQEQERLHSEYSHFFVCEETPDHEQVSRILAIIDALHVATDCSLVDSILVPDSVAPWKNLKDQDVHAWGHHNQVLDVASLQFAMQHHDVFNKMQQEELPNRFSTAFQIYNSGLRTNLVDAAMILMISAMEALFLSKSTEIKFRLAIYVSYFLEKDLKKRQAVFDEVRQLYDIRSTLVHGGDLKGSEESAAIWLVDHCVPAAEYLVRRCLQEILDSNLVPLFRSKSGRGLESFPSRLSLGFDRADALKLSTGSHENTKGH